LAQKEQGVKNVNGKKTVQNSLNQGNTFSLANEGESDMEKQFTQAQKCRLLKRDPI
jgi:hypothetical protein